MSSHILGDRGLTHIDAKLEELAVDPRCTPERVRQAHAADQLTNFEWHFRPANSSARLPAPEQAKPGPMPADDCLRLDDHQRFQNVRCEPIEAAKNEAIKIVEGGSLRRFSTQHIELMAQRHTLRLERGSRPQEPGDHPLDQFENVSHQAEHRPIRNFMPAR